jgi:hypothetical protein
MPAEAIMVAWPVERVLADVYVTPVAIGVVPFCDYRASGDLILIRLSRISE